nr:Uncharacterised protein [Providencia rettgeri]
MSSIKFDSDFSKHGIKFKLIKIAFKISKSTRMINLIRATNCFFFLYNPENKIMRHLTFFFLLIPPLFYLRVAGHDNIGAILSIIGLVISIILTPPINLKISFRKFSLLLAIFSFIIYIILNNIFIKSDIGYLTGGVIGGYIYLYQYFYSPFPFNVLNIISKYVIVTSIIILSIDLYYRFFINPIDKENIGRYAFKFGIIDADSNFSGIYSSLMFFYCLFLVNTYQKIQKVSSCSIYTCRIFFISSCNKCYNHNVLLF